MFYPRKKNKQKEKSISYSMLHVITWFGHLRGHSMFPPMPCTSHSYPYLRVEKLYCLLISITISLFYFHEWLDFILRRSDQRLLNNQILYMILWWFYDNYKNLTPFKMWIEQLDADETCSWLSACISNNYWQWTKHLILYRSINIYIALIKPNGKSH